MLNFHRFQYQVVIDVDEAIIPTNPDDYTWHDLLKRLDFDQEYVAFLPENSRKPHSTSNFSITFL